MDTAGAYFKQVAKAKKVAPKLVPEMRLREKGGGVLEGQSLGVPSTLAKKAGIPAREFRPDGGESWLDVNKRVQSFTLDLVRNHMPKSETTDVELATTLLAASAIDQEEEKKQPTEGATASVTEPRILCVTHGGLITEFLNYVDSMQPTGTAVPATRGNKAKNCAIFVFKIRPAANEQGFMIDIIKENDVSHLTA